ncbi:MAG: hypothetical protein HOP17_13725 [Acidobacteria bacterium]|nr:hypothetical protein [Acidobacteriota bacterium]
MAEPVGTRRSAHRACETRDTRISLRGMSHVSHAPADIWSIAYTFRFASRVANAIAACDAR